MRRARLARAEARTCGVCSVLFLLLWLRRACRRFGRAWQHGFGRNRRLGAGVASSGPSPALTLCAYPYLLVRHVTPARYWATTAGRLVSPVAEID